jgi:hypothetical protein
MKQLFTLFLSLTVWIITDAQIFVKHDATGTNDGTSWADAFTDLQDALSTAIAGDQIWIASGTYSPDGPTPDSSHFVVHTDVEIYGGFAGTETELNQRDWIKNTTIISGDKNGDDVPGQFTSNRTDNAHHVLIVDAPDGTCVIDGLTFQGGMTRIDALNPNDADIPYNRWRGGAMYILTSAVVNNCTFRDNYGYQGTGLFAFSASPDDAISIENSKFESNNATTAGACYISGWNSVTVNKSIFTNNEAASFGAGLVLGNSNSTVSECVFESNVSGSEGGACMLFQNSFITIPDPTITFARCQFINNSSGTRGGALGFNNYSLGFTLTIDSCTFSENQVTSANGVGGAVRLADFTDSGIIGYDVINVNILNSIFNKNSAAYSGAFNCIVIDDSLSVHISNVEFVDNEALQSPGGIYLGSANGKLSFDIDNTAFIRNTAESYAGALETYAVSGIVRNSTFIDNQGITASGACDIGVSTIAFEDCRFTGNSTGGTFPGYEGGGGGIFWGGTQGTVRNSIFEGNSSETHGSAALILYGANLNFENVLFHENSGNSTIANRAAMSLVNTTSVNNDYGLFLTDASQTEVQNSIFNNIGDNLTGDGAFIVTSNGGNISSDASMTLALTGFGEYEDLHDTDPLLGPDFVPLPGSPAIDAGNSEGVTAFYDLAGNPRTSGKAIDIGSYESFISRTKDAVWNDPACTIFPNPVIDILHMTLESDYIGEVALVIYNYSGQPVHRSTYHKSEITEVFEENVSRLVQGAYVLLCISDLGTYASNFVIQK